MKSQSSQRICILHIGLEKTGSTSIQTWVYKNEKTLNSVGLGLTRSFSRPNNWDFVNFFQNGLDDWASRKGIHNQQQKKHYFANFERDFDQEIGGLASRNVLLTSEHFSSRLRSTEELLRLREFLTLRFDQIKVLAWFRPQWEVAVSSWSTSLKSGHSASLEDWLKRVVEDNYYFNYEKIARNWSDVFGKENCIFKIFESNDSTQSDVVTDFLNALEPIGFSLHSNVSDFISERQNISMSYLEALVLRAINSKAPYWIHHQGVKEFNKLNKDLRKGLPRLKTAMPITISIADKFRIYEEFKESNQRFFKEFFGGNGFGEPNPLDISSNAQNVDMLQDLLSLVSYFLEFTSTEYRPSLQNSDADLLRDSALRILSLGDRESALGLLKLAHKARPDGPVINMRIRELEALIERKELN